jgi:protein-tyrosine kinase
VNTLQQIRTPTDSGSGNDGRIDGRMDSQNHGHNHNQADEFLSGKPGWNDEPLEDLQQRQQRQQKQRDARSAAGIALARSQALADAAALRSFAAASGSTPISPVSPISPASPISPISHTAASIKVAAPLPSSIKASAAPASFAAEVMEVDLERLQRLGHLVSPSQRSRLTEEFRHIKRPLLANMRRADAAAQRATLIMVTSALPREGKTFFSLNLALSLATEVDTSVLLVDADVVQPELMKRMGVPPRLGLLDLLTRPELCLSDVVLRTHIPKLSLLPSGTPNDLSSELLGSEAMAHLLTSMAQRCPGRIVIFDAPPLLVTNEAQVLASRVGQVVMVVEASKSPMASVSQAFAMLESCPVVMAVLNKVPASPLSNGYGSYGG